ncbi:MAG: glutamine-hydrolyzing carbamoyl-phosphate synthase small subunit [Candidatus Caenarcaniphilales bacterium]|nr:glutamine-hydrolyzing carbamoyl-phosphate synthase small subunit [Candidatus Caenarcaniphilales bacterium]
MNRACLILEDGKQFEGKALGKLENKTFGEIVFNTGITGYQEILTDPSYAKQVVTLTYPEIGNYGTCAQDNQSRRVFASGLVIKNNSMVESSWRNQESLQEFLLKHNLSAIASIDTRSLTRYIRSKGTMRCVLSTEEDCMKKASELLKEVLEQPTMDGQDLTGFVTTKQKYSQKAIGRAIGKVAVLDYGLKQNMLDILSALGFDLEVFPATTSFDEIASLKPDGIFLSNGPGDPDASKEVVETVKNLIEADSAPIFGVCLGHQILALALGAKTYKLKFGHRGSNHPVKDLTSGKVMITSQNHGFAVQEDSLKNKPIRVTHISLNDSTIEGIEHTSKNIFSVQFHPEACPGPRETSYLFEKFTKKVLEKK